MVDVNPDNFRRGNSPFYNDSVDAGYRGQVGRIDPLGTPTPAILLDAPGTNAAELMGRAFRAQFQTTIVQRYSTTSPGRGRDEYNALYTINWGWGIPRPVTQPQYITIAAPTVMRRCGATTGVAVGAFRQYFPY